MSPVQHKPFFLWQISPVPPDLTIDFQGGSSQGFDRPVNNFHFGLQEGFFTRSDVCFGLLSCWKTKERLRRSVAVECLRFCSKS